MHRSTEPASIIERIKSGSEKELIDIYSRHREEFVIWIKRKFDLSTDEAKDIYQMTVISFYENIMEGKLTMLNSSLKTYLFAIGKNKALENKRYARRFSGEPSDRVLQNAEQPSEFETEEEQKLFEKNLATVELCLQELGDPCKTILEDFYYHKQDMQHIMERLGYKTTDTVKTIKYKCMQRLRKLFSEKISQLT